MASVCETNGSRLVHAAVRGDALAAQVGEQASARRGRRVEVAAASGAHAADTSLEPAQETCSVRWASARRQSLALPASLAVS